MAKANTVPATAVNRSSAGLRDAIFDEIDAIRNGSSNPTRANAVAKLAGSIVETVRMELDVQRYAHQTAGQATAIDSVSSLPRPLALGAA